MIDVRQLAEAVLLFHRGGPWTQRDRRRWLQLTGSSDCTHRVLCDLARRVKDGHEGPVLEWIWRRHADHPDLYVCVDTKGDELACVKGKLRAWRFLTRISSGIWSEEYPSALRARHQAEAVLVAVHATQRTA